MKGVSVKVAILSFPSQLAMKPLHTKKSAMTEPPFLLFQTFGLISSNFVFQIFAAFFWVEKLGHNLGKAT